MNKKAIYGGCFDPCTMGHLHIITKASKIFDSVEVVIAENPKKSSMFSVEDRLVLLKDMVSSLSNVTVSILPSHLYLVKYAEENGTQYLIRGIRDTIDFPYELNIYITNRNISNNVETVYLMPDNAYAMVSSSWVKGLIGMNGWRDLIKPYVSSKTLCKLEEKTIFEYAKKVYNSLDKDGYLRDGVSFGDMWGDIVKGYSNNVYHGFSHLIDGIELMNKFDLEKCKLPLFSFAWLMHDVNKSEEISSSIAGKYTCLGDCNRLIMATKHNKCEYDFVEEGIIASIDLMILASGEEKYQKYVEGVYQEYLQASGKNIEDFNSLWIKGRSEFLRKMLARKYIFPDPIIRERNNSTCSFYNNEAMARNNMSGELDSLTW